MKFKNLNVLVYGLSMSGEWASRLLINKRANVFLYDDNFEILKSKTIKNCFMLNSLNENLIEQFDLIIVSPSIPLDNEFLVKANERNITIMSELEFASMFCKNYVAITGTNGKTTTTELVTDILNKKYKAVACGNIGYPLSRAFLEKKNYIKVIEVSSFMLEHANKFSPHVATILNISPDHLIRHKTMENYTALKKSIFKNLKSNDYAVINLDDNIHLTSDTLKITYSQKHTADVYLKDGAIYLHEHKIANINELKLTGKHNISNIMCAICFGYIYKVRPELIRQAILSYTPEHFRIENVGVFNQIKFINDSKSTNIASTLASVESTKGAIILLLGGSNKMLNFDELFNKLSKRVKFVIFYGEIAENLEKANDNKFDYSTCADLKEAFNIATTHALAGDTILLSPATASYDQYSNYIERGKHFNELVMNYETECTKK